MPIDDLWYLKKRDPDTKKPLPSRRHGRGKRWRVRYVDADGNKREMLFDLKRDPHNKPDQHKDYDRELWWAWLFYIYLASIALVVRLVERQKGIEGSTGTNSAQ